MATRYTVRKLVIVGVLLALIVLLLSVSLPKFTQLQTSNDPAASATTLQATVSKAQAMLPSVQRPLLATQPQTSTIETQGLRLNLATNQQSYVLGEPISLTLTIQTIQATAKALHLLLEPPYGFVVTQIRYEDEEYTYYGGPGFGIVDYILGPPSSLPPGKQLVERRKILYEPRADDPKKFYALSRAGNYSLRMVLDNIVPNQQITTAAVQIEVIAPVGLDKQIWRLLQTADAASFLHSGSVANPQPVIANFNAILTQYENSFYAPYLQMALNTYQANQGKAETDGQAAKLDSLPALRTVDEQLYFVRSTSEGNSRPANRIDEEIPHKIIDAVQVWVDAWNNRDMERYVQSYSFTTTFRQKWEKGPGNLNHDAIRERLPGTFQSKGMVSVGIIGFNMGTEEIILEVVGRFEPGSGQGDFFDTMRFIKDDDSVWRLVSPGWQ